MNILVIGGGGREHVLTWKIAQSPNVEKIYCIPGNGGIEALAECVSMNPARHDQVIDFMQSHQIDLAVIGPEAPLAEGLVDALQDAGLRAFGPSKRATLIESSKVYAKNLMRKYNIPTADFWVFESDEQAIEFLKTHNRYPIVIKADGLAAGKGVIIAQDQKEAFQAILEMMIDGKFGDAGKHIVIEEFLAGTEISVLTFTDGNVVVPMVSAKDYKKIGEGDTGLNTGGMGAISPNPIYTDELKTLCQNTIFEPTIQALKREGHPFQGVLYFGLILTANGPKVLEYNARFGDPEAQVVLPRLETDLVEIMNAVLDGTLADLSITWSDQYACTVVMASGGYPGSYSKGFPIEGIEDVTSGIVFQAGTVRRDGVLTTWGGRVLAVTGLGDDLDHAVAQAYAGVEKIRFENAYFRKDIGK
ncbi:MAG: phosphoribosylamine--glycine ligase [Gemmatimonadetes bacterium]|nr:MAG: phosphoribosylamine--glycine ligase [Gemmatimonadota bacterium]